VKQQEYQPLFEQVLAYEVMYMSEVGLKKWLKEQKMPLA
jgi:hypothetical protein